MNRVYAWTIPTALIAVLALVVSLSSLPGGSTSPAADGGDGASSEPQTIAVKLVDLAIQPETIRAEAGRPIALAVSNQGAVQHNLAVDGHGRTPMLDAGSSAALDLGSLEAGTYALRCEVAGHAEAGMTGTLEVGAVPASDHAATTRMDPKQMDAEYLAGVAAFPAKTRGQGGRRMTPDVVGGVKVFELTADELEWEVSPGELKPAMAYNGMVPGPEIRVRLGDRVRVVLRNRLAESTSIHFHGLDVPNAQDGVPGLTQDLVLPGGSFTYEFTVPNAGTHMYHSHMNGAAQVPMGLLGAFIVEGPDEPDADLDVPLVLNDGPLGYTINGKGFPATQPIAAAPGQTIRVRYMNEGLTGHPMHLHGMSQLVIAKDGYPIPQPYRVDTLWIAPGERYDVLVEAREGAWAFHCHILTHAENEHGMFGMVTAVVVAT